MQYKCLVFDHDDTVVNSTATIHHPCFVEYLREFRPGRTCSLEDYFLKNFEPGFLTMCREEYGLSDAELTEEGLRGKFPARTGRGVRLGAAAPPAKARFLAPGGDHAPLLSGPLGAADDRRSEARL